VGGEEGGEPEKEESGGVPKRFPKHFDPRISTLFGIMIDSSDDP
jgi:hypothetical protein